MENNIIYNISRGSDIGVEKGRFKGYMARLSKKNARFLFFTECPFSPSLTEQASRTMPAGQWLCSAGEL